MWRQSVLRDRGRAAVLARPANDSIRPLATVELALKVRPAPSVRRAGRFTLDPQYARWMATSYPHAAFHIAPLGDYDRRVRAPDAALTMEELAANLHAEVEREGGYALSPSGAWWSQTAMFVVGSTSARGLVEFLFAWS